MKEHDQLCDQTWLFGLGQKPQKQNCRPGGGSLEFLGYDLRFRF